MSKEHKFSSKYKVRYVVIEGPIVTVKKVFRMCSLTMVGHVLQTFYLFGVCPSKVFFVQFLNTAIIGYFVRSCLQKKI